MATKQMNYEQYSRQEDTLRLTCECGWEGKATETYTEMHDEFVDLSCPKCNKKVLILNLKPDPPIFINSINNKTFKNDAEQLVYRYRSCDDPINIAGHLCAEIIWEYKHVDPDLNERELEYWESTLRELEKMSDMK